MEEGSQREQQRLAPALQVTHSSPLFTPGFETVEGATVEVLQVLSVVQTVWLEEAVLKVWLSRAAKIVLGMTLKTSTMQELRRFPLCVWK